MCLYPRLIKNKKFTVNKKNGGNVPKINDDRTKYVPVGCGQCIECKKQKAKGWQIRLLEEIKKTRNGKFVTFTFSNNSIRELDNAVADIEKEAKVTWSQGYERDNKIATLGVRRFLERWRKEHKKSIRHWFITELGGNGTENIHLHGIIFTELPLNHIEEKWQYGHLWIGDYVNERTVNYIIKYVYKTDLKHKHYNPRVLTSKGIGSNYITTANAINNRYNHSKTNETYRTRTGHKMALPVYYRNKLYTEDEKESLWIQKLDKEIRWVRGQKIDISKGEKTYNKILEEEQKLNKEMGYGGNEAGTWEQKQFENERRNMNRKERKHNANKNKRS